MPIIHIKTNIDFSEQEKNEILLSVSRLVAEVMGKPISDIMVIHSCCDIVLNASFELAAFIDFRCVSGLNCSVSKSICEGILSIFRKTTRHIEASRIYVNFFEVSRTYAWHFVDNSAVCSENTKQIS